MDQYELHFTLTELDLDFELDVELDLHQYELQFTLTERA